MPPAGRVGYHADLDVPAAFPVCWSGLPIAALAGLALVAGGALGQARGGAIGGIVGFPSGTPAVGAEVTLVREAGGSSRTTVTGGDGAYTFSSLEPGDYTLTARCGGSLKLEPRHVTVRNEPILVGLTFSIQLPPSADTGTDGALPLQNGKGCGPKSPGRNHKYEGRAGHVDDFLSGVTYHDKPEFREGGFEGSAEGGAHSASVPKVRSDKPVPPLSVAPPTAPGAGAMIQGVVSQPSGDPVPGAKVTLISQRSSARRDTVTASDGGYRFVALEVGVYTLTVELAGFRKAVRPHITLGSSGELVLNLVLRRDPR